MAHQPTGRKHLAISRRCIVLANPQRNTRLERRGATDGAQEFDGHVVGALFGRTELVGLSLLIQIDIAPAPDVLVQKDAGSTLAEHLSHEHELHDAFLGQDLEKRVPERAIGTALLDDFQGLHGFVVVLPM